MRNNSKSRQNEAPQQTLRERAAQTRDAAGRFLTRAGDADAPQVQTARPEASLGTIPASSNASPNAYGLQIDANGLGLHAAPGASVLVEPEMPTKAGLAVFYMRGGRGPAIFDLTRDFRPEFARLFSSGSEVMPLIEVVDPVTGEFGRMRADQVGTIHRITGIFTPADIMGEHLFCPTHLPEIAECLESMGEHYVEGAAAYPLVRPGETVVYDPSRREPTDGALCVLQWSSGTRDVLLTNKRSPNSKGETHWFADPVNRPSSRKVMERRQAAGKLGLLYASDGPYTEGHLRERIVGTVVGVLAPWRETTARSVLDPDTVSKATLEQPPSADDIRANAERVRATAALSALNDAGLTSAVSPAVRAAIIQHGKVMEGTREPSDDNDEFDRQASMQIEAENAVATTPASTLADVRAKLAYMIPIIEPYLLDLDHAEHLRAIRDDLDRLCRMQGMNEDSNDLVFEAIRAQGAAWDAFGLTCSPTDKAWRREQGLDTSDEAMAAPDAAWKAAHEAEIAAWNAVFETRPTTLPGLVAMIRHAQRWASSHDGIDGCLDTDDVLQRITIDAERVLWAALDGRGGVRPDLSKLPTEELAAMSFEPINRSTSHCPVPSRDAWIKDADMALPWLRMGWLYLSLNRGELADAMLAEEAQHADDFDYSLQAAARNFDQLARFARAVLDRRLIGLATLAVREGARCED